MRSMELQILGKEQVGGCSKEKDHDLDFGSVKFADNPRCPLNRGDLSVLHRRRLLLYQHVFSRRCDDGTSD